MTKLSFKNINKLYPNGVHAINHFNLDIDHSEFIVFIGPSGSGKSTLLRMIAGLEDITSGELWIDDQLSNHLPSNQRQVAMVFQNYALFNHMSVEKNISFNLNHKTMTSQEISKRVQDIAILLDIQELLTRKPNELSGGQQQRVAIARALVSYPKVVLMDEPLSHLDLQLKTQMLSILHDLHQRLDITFIYVTHDQNEAMTLGSRIIVLNDGKLQQADAPSRLYQSPNNLFVANFIGSPKINVMDARIKDNQILLHHELLSIPLDSPCFLSSQEVILGIRPEHIIIHKNGMFNGHIRQIQTIGSDCYFIVEWNCIKLNMKVSSLANVYMINEEIRFNMNLEKILIFDKITKNRLK